MKSGHKETQIALPISTGGKKEKQQEDISAGHHEYLLGYIHTKCSAVEKCHWQGKKSLSKHNRAQPKDIISCGSLRYKV